MFLLQNVANELQALQIAHESMSPDVARAVAEMKFPDGISFINTRLTVLDVMAIMFVSHHHPSAHTIE